jgi:hypothetical protein
MLEELGFAITALVPNLESSHDPSLLGFGAMVVTQSLHFAASCVQIFCLGLQSFVRAHTGMPQFSLLDHEASEYIWLVANGLARHDLLHT